MALEALKEIKDLTKREIIDRMQSGQFTPPSPGKDRDEFFSFVGMSKEEREAYLAKAEGAAPAAPEGEPKDPPDPATPPADPVPTEPAAPAESKDPAPAAADGPWWQTMGYETEEKAAEAHKRLLETQGTLQDQINSLNAKEGKRGQELRRLQEENVKLIREMNTARGGDDHEAKKPERPKRPNPKDFQDGAFDAGYVEACEKYDANLDAYQEQMETYQREKIAREVSEKITPKVDPQVEATEAWNKFFDSDIPAFQAKFGLSTTVPIRRISDSYSVINDQNATQQDKAVAQAFVESLPQTDRDAYLRVKEAVGYAFDFQAGVPRSNYRTIEGALADLGLLGKFTTTTPTPSKLTPEEEKRAREQAQAKNRQAVAATPSSQNAAGDRPLSEHQTSDEDRKAYRQLLNEYNVALQTVSGRTVFEKSERFKELCRLRTKLGFKSRASQQVTS